VEVKVMKMEYAIIKKTILEKNKNAVVEYKKNKKRNS